MSSCGSLIISHKQFTTGLYLWLIWRSWLGRIRGLKVVRHRCIVRDSNLFLESTGFVGRSVAYTDNALEVSYWVGSDHHKILYPVKMGGL